MDRARSSSALTRAFRMRIAGADRPPPRRSVSTNKGATGSGTSAQETARPVAPGGQPEVRVGHRPDPFHDISHRAPEIRGIDGTTWCDSLVEGPPAGRAVAQLTYVDDLRLAHDHGVGQELIVAGHVVVQHVLDRVTQLHP